MGKLKIAITADTYQKATDVINHQRAPFAPRGLVDVLADLGAIPVILPDVQGADGKDYAELFDGLVLPGGADVDPTFFGEEPRWKVGGANYKRDAFELELFKAFYAAKKPVLGICRGCQVINIALGGNVYQDLQSENPHCTIRHSQGADGAYPTHHVSLAPGSCLAGILGPTAYVNSRHHQAIKDVAPALHVTATAPDGVIEGVEDAQNFILGVQWHPENMWQEHPEMKKIFAAFLDGVRRTL